MKQVWPNYSYSPTTNVLTLTGLNIDRDQLLLVTAADRGRIMYNFADSSVTASAFTSGANTALTLVATTAGLTTTAALVIYYDDQLASTTVTVSSLPAVSGTVTANVFGKKIDGTGDFLQIPIIPYDQDITSASDQYAVPVQISTLNGSVGSSTPMPISGTVTIGSALPTGTNRIGVVTVGAGTVTIGAGTAQIGSVTASISGTVPISISSVTIGNSITIGSCVTHGVTIANSSVTVNGTFFQGTQPVSLTTLPALVAGTAQIGSVTVGNTVTIAGTVTANPTGTQTIAGSVTIGAGIAQIGSVTASISGTVPVSISSVTVGNSVTIGSLPAISGTVTANLSISATAITSGSFTSLASATLVPANTARKMATVYNLGAGQLFINAGATATTLGGGFMVVLSSGDFYECNYTTTTLSAIFSTAGTASWISH